MRLILPDGAKIYLEGNIPYAERVKKVNEILADYEDHFASAWDTKRTKVCLDILATYLSRAKDFREGNSNPTLSTRKQAALDQGDSKCAPFSSLPIKLQQEIGIVDINDQKEIG